MGDPLAGYESLTETCAAFEMSDWACLELTGDDRVGWLQGQATNDVLRLATEGSRVSFCICQPTGGLLAVLDAWSLPGRIVMTTARELASVVLDRIERMTILEDVAARQLDLRGISIQGPTAATTIEGVDALILKSHRAGVGGWDVWSADQIVDEIRSKLPPLGQEAYEAARIEAGIPKWGIEMGSKTLAPELGVAFESRHVSYAKGCYTGQEVLMRIHSRGHTNKTWVALVASSPLTVGEAVWLGDTSVGTVQAVAFSPAIGYLGTATLRNEAAVEGVLVRVGSVESEVRMFPLVRSS